MGMTFGGNPYGPLMEAMARRQQMQQQQRQQPQQMMQPIGGTMQLQPGQFGGGGGGGASGASGLAGGMPSASSMADMLKRMQGTGNGPSLYERFQGWGSDLGSRMPEQTGAPIQTYQPGQTPAGGLY